MSQDDAKLTPCPRCTPVREQNRGFHCVGADTTYNADICALCDNTGQVIEEIAAAYILMMTDGYVRIQHVLKLRKILQNEQ